MIKKQTNPAIIGFSGLACRFLGPFIDLMDNTRVGNPQKEAFANGPTLFLIPSPFTVSSPATTPPYPRIKKEGHFLDF